jgi:uncharacterized protein
MIIEVRVIPNAKKARIETFDAGIKVYLTEPATEGKANKKLVETLAKYYNTRKYNVRIVKGDKQRNKVVEITQ